MKYFILLITFTVVLKVSTAQPTTRLKANSAATKLTILHTSTSDFPKMTITFRAENQRGEPVYNLQKEDLAVLENENPYTIESLRPAASAKPLYLSIVFDHSASMEEDPSQLYDKNGKPLFTLDENENMIVGDDYVAPIDHAKIALEQFVSGFNLKKDLVSITSFSSKVDKPLPLTHDTRKINTLIRSLKAEGKTALYDAMMAGLEQIRKIDEDNRVLVVLTDGQDNMSWAKWNDVVNTATQNAIPVYIIGLGEVNKTDLEKIAKETGGEFFYTATSGSLQSIYSTISRKIQTLYEVTYHTTEVVAAMDEQELSSGVDNAATTSLVATTAAKAPVNKVSTASQTIGSVGLLTTSSGLAGISENSLWIYICVALLLIAGSLASRLLRRKNNHAALTSIHA